MQDLVPWTLREDFESKSGREIMAGQDRALSEQICG